MIQSNDVDSRRRVRERERNSARLDILMSPLFLHRHVSLIFFFSLLFLGGRNCDNRKSQSRNDECLVAQERLHPDCARRPERYHLPPPPAPPASSGGSGGATAMGGSMASSSPALGTNEASPPHHTPACHHLAEECKAHPDCK